MLFRVECNKPVYEIPDSKTKLARRTSWSSSWNGYFSLGTK